MITIKSKKKSYGINFPSSINEITAEHLNVISKDIRLPKHYCIVALAFTTKVFDFVTAMNSKHSSTVGVTPILCKIHEEDSNTINAKVGDKIIVDRSSLERGVHINLKTCITSNSARNYFNNDSDLIKSIMTNSDNDDIKSKTIIVLEFKIIPVNDISASLPIDSNTDDPFLNKVNMLN